MTSSLLYNTSYINHRTASSLQHPHSQFLYPTPNHHHHSAAVSQSLHQNHQTAYHTTTLSPPRDQPLSVSLDVEIIKFDCNLVICSRNICATLSSLYPLRSPPRIIQPHTPLSTSQEPPRWPQGNTDPSSLFRTANQLRKNVFYFGQSVHYQAGSKTC